SPPRPPARPPDPPGPAGPHGLLRRPPAQQELPRGPLRWPEVRPRRGPRRRPPRPPPAARPSPTPVPFPSPPPARTRPAAAQPPRRVNQSPPRLALTSPELPLLPRALPAGGVLEPVPRYPTAPRLAEAAAADRAALPSLPDAQGAPLREHARAS